MSEQVKSSIPVRAGDIIQLPWQGSWQVRAGRLKAPVDLLGAHLPLLAVETKAGWTLARVQVSDDDAVWGLRLQHQPGELQLTLTGEWHTPPSWEVREFGGRDSMFSAIRSKLPAPGRRDPPAFERAFILDIHDTRGKLIQTFDDVAGFLRQCAGLGIARGSLLYLPGWAGLYDGNYPDYEPAPAAGGRDGLARLAAAAREAGAFVAPHLNHWALTKSRESDYPRLLEHRLRDARGRFGEWPGIALMGMSHPLWYVDPSSEPWIEHLSGRVELLQRLGIEVVFFDQVAPPLGDNWRRQTREFMRAMHARFPQMIFGSESVHADILNALGFAQLWGPVWSVMPEVPVLNPSPFLAEVVRPWLRILGHLSTPAPYPAPYAWTNFVYLAEHGPQKMFRAIWEFHRNSGVLPTARLVSTRTRASEKLLRRLFAA